MPTSPQQADTSLFPSVQRLPLPAGLYIVATPIGNLRDITLRALDTLASVSVILCEDTRHSQKLLNHFNIRQAKLVPFHDHNEKKLQDKVLAWCHQGKAVALISDAGTPLIADPGYALVRACHEAGAMVTVIAGASAVTAALVISGLPTDSFHFAGFLAKTKGARLAQARAVASLPCTTLFYVSPHKLATSLADVAAVMPTRQAVLVRELTKLHETCHRGTLQELAALDSLKGEMVLVIAGAELEILKQTDVDVLLAQALKVYSVKEAAAHVAAQAGLPKRDIYQRALKLNADG